MHDRRKEKSCVPGGKRYEDLKAESASAADRIAKATEEVCEAFRRITSKQQQEKAS